MSHNGYWVKGPMSFIVQSGIRRDLENQIFLQSTIPQFNLAHN